MPFQSHELYTNPTEKRIPSPPTPPRCSSRYSLLKDLAAEIWEEERNAEFLFRAFDLVIADEEPGPSVDPVTASVPPDRTPKSDLENATAACDHSVTASSLPTETRRAPLIHSENPFLSTPLRLKHFPRLSPSILRGLLRSPSLRVPTPDGSFADEISDLSIFKQDGAALESSGFMYWCRSPDPCECLDQESYPLTPPSTGQMPTLNRFQSSPGYTNSNGDPPTEPLGLARNLILPHTSCSSPFATNAPHPLPSTAKHSELTIETARLLVCKHSSNSLVAIENLPDAIQHTDRPISPAALINFRLVLNELQGTEDNPDERRRTLLSSLRTSVYLPLSTPDPSTLDPDANVPSSSFLPNHRQSQASRKLGSLEVEFTTLLLQRAIQEEAEAGDLRMLARRLEWLAKGKRQLASVVIAAVA